MRIATITNWAYGATVCLTIASGIIMLMASSADTLERQAVEQRQKFDQLTEDIETDIWAQSDLARLYVIKKDPQVLKEYNQAENSLKSIELRLEKLQDNGASDEELALLHEGIKIVDELQDEQQTALSSLERGCRGDSINTLMQIAAVLNVSASELMRRIEDELKRGPRPPEKEPGRPRKSAKKNS